MIAFRYLAARGARVVPPPGLLFHVLSAWTLAACLPALALAQGTQAPPAPADSQPASTPPRVTAGWRDGFVVESEQGDFRLQVGLLLHADGRFVPGDDDDAVTDQFVIRRARPYLRGRFAQHFEFYFNPDFAGGNLVVQDAYLDAVFSPAFRVRAGKAKTPFGLERLHSAANMLFFERALPNSLAPNRDVGIQVLGDLSGGLVSYAGGVVNGAPDGLSVDTDTSDSKDLAGRLVVRPFTNDKESPLRGLGVAIAGTRGKQTGSGTLATLRTASVQQPFFSYSGAAADGVRTRYSPQVFYYHQAFAALGEYVHNELPVRRGSAADAIATDAWQIAAAYVITGEAATDSSSGIKPQANFDFGNGHYGALQVGVRYHVLEVDERAFDLNLATPGSSRKAEAWTAGLNWFLTPNLKYVFNFERTVFDDDADGARKAENAVVFRTQVSF
jgi:phosphate-selective porin OprO/OprP